MERSAYFVVLALVATLLATRAHSQDTSPIKVYVMKVVKDVEFRSSDSGDWKKVMPVTELQAGCELRTGDKSFVMIKFIDDSKIALRERSQIAIEGTVSDKHVRQRDIIINQGRVVFNIKNNEPVICRILSPVSAAILKGGEGGASYDAKIKEATLTAGSSGVEFSSTQVKCSVRIPAGRTAIIDSTGCRMQKQ
jgi:hypothetical protein